MTPTEYLDYRKERHQTQADALAAACEAFARRTGQAATAVQAPPSWVPPLGCALRWDGRASQPADTLRVWSDAPRQAALL